MSGDTARLGLTGWSGLTSAGFGSCLATGAAGGVGVVFSFALSFEQPTAHARSEASTVMVFMRRILPQIAVGSRPWVQQLDACS